MPNDSKLVQIAFGQVLREVRSSQGMSQQSLALNSDLDRTYVSLLERGLRQPTLTTIYALSRTLHIDPAHLVDRTSRAMHSS
ncbi:helix-turn-helix domain-containing protein [Stenotrophomonas maltophilia]|uniref:helix-turn-helix domain-containing protein n=1 Tax=Stenotrophomonas maltophilia TaxID=40324 RepID=UPI0038C6DEA1